MNVVGREKASFLEMRKLIENEDHIDSLDSLDAPFLKNYKFLEMKLETLEDLILFGLAFRGSSAGLVFVDLVSELKLVDHMPFLIAVDAYNSWEVPSAFHYENVPIAAKQLCVPYALQFLSTRKAEQGQWQMTNGLCIAAVSANKVEARHITYTEILRSIPFSLHVPTYSAIEFLSASVHYMKSGFFPKATEAHELLAFRMHTGSVPKLVRDESATYLLSLDLSKDSNDVASIDLGPLDGFGDGQGEAVPNREISLEEIEDKLVGDSDFTIDEDVDSPEEYGKKKKQTKFVAARGVKK